MKKEITSFDLRKIVSELQVLIGGYLDKVYQLDDELFLRFHLPREGRREVYHRVGRWLALVDGEEKPEAPGPFAQALRKALPNPRVQAVRQMGFDRIVLLDFTQGSDEYRIVMEVFGKGNVLLLRGDQILQAFRLQVFRDRDLRPGAPYIYPPGGADPLAMAADEFRRALGESRKSLVKALATDFNLGGLYAEEVCLRAGIPKDAKAQALGDMEKGTLHAVLQTLAEETLRGPPGLVLEGDTPVDAVPCTLQFYRDHGFRPTATLSEALAAYIAAVREEEPEDEAAARLRRRLEAQERSLGELNVQETEAGAAADLLYSHYAEAESFLNRLWVAGGEGGGQRQRPPAQAVLEIEGRPVALDPTLGVDSNAQHFYQVRKEAREKSLKVEAAIRRTREELARREKRVRRAEPARAFKPSKRFWFEAYRWFISSDGFLCLGGRDAKSNDKLVKRHLQDGDRYAHADIQGAPSVVVKGGSGAPEATLREACQFSLHNSKAWAAGLASGSAYWVLPEQVSKRAESGEFLRTGSFVIRGKRNYFQDLPMEVAVGEILHEGARKIMAGPPSALQGRSPRWLLLRPGRGEREKVARTLAEEFAVPLGEIQGILPPGGMEVVRDTGSRATEASSHVSKR